MQCDFCSAPLPEAEPENVALLQHLQERSECNTSYGYLMENLESSWTKSMSGG